MGRCGARHEADSSRERGLGLRACAVALAVGAALGACASGSGAPNSDSLIWSGDTDDGVTETDPPGDSEVTGDTDALQPVDAATQANLEIALAHFHDAYSGDEVLELFPDACGPYMQATGVCVPAEHRTVAICGGKLDHLLTDAEIPSQWTLATRGCAVTPVYLGSDPRLATPVP